MTYVERVPSHRYVKAVWQKTTDGTSYWVPADGCWDLIFVRRPDSVRVFIAGPMTRAKITQHAEGAELFGIRFKTSICMSQLPASTVVDRTIDLHRGAARSPFWLEGAQYELPTNETAELFVDKLCTDRVLVRDAVVEQVLEDRIGSVSSRSIQRHFVQTSGLTRKFIEQVERVQLAAKLLESNARASDVAVQAGYADQAHMIRSFKALLGYTPSQIVHA